MGQKLSDAIKEIHSEHEKATKDRDNEKIKDCLDRYRILANSAPDEPNLLYYIATAEMQLGYNGVAVSLFKRVISQAPSFYQAWNNLGICYKNENMNEEASMVFNRSLRFKEDPDVYNNIATLYVNEGCPDEGIAFAEKAIEMSPTHEQAHWNRSLMLLEKGDWRNGFSEYEWGLLSKDRPNRSFSNPIEKIPYWDGTPCKEIIVYGEQGMGDEIMWASCLEDLSKVCETIIFECHPRMEGLFRRSFPFIKHFYPTRKEGTIDWVHHHEPSFRVGIGSLFKFFRLDGDFPKKKYLTADTVLVGEYIEKLKELGPGPYVGIGWSGGTKRTRNDQRSFKLKQLLPILEKKATFINLQYTEGSDDKCRRFYEEHGIKIHHLPAIYEKDYDHTAALISSLDLCIVPNTTVVHLAGALGVNCWTLTPDACAWRYQAKGLSRGDEMPFYGPWVSQYRQSGDWERCIKYVSKRLSRFSRRSGK